MNKNIIISIVVLLAILGDLLFIEIQKNGAEATPLANKFTVIGKNFSFEPADISVKKGDTVKITFKDDDGYHDLKIDGYDVATERVETGQESSVSFVADKSGSFEYYCTVGNHRENGMKGTLVVTE